jgi:predicted DNA binding protein
MVSGTGTRDTWTIELRCEHREDLTTFQECCERNDIRVELTALHDVTSAEVGDRYGLTAAQREAIVSSYERGYWQSPRETSLEELAAEFGISGQAFGSRLRRGLGRLIERTLVPRTEQSK